MKVKYLEALGSPAIHQCILQETPLSVPGTWGGGLPQNQEHGQAAGQCPKGSDQWSCI